MIYSGRSPLGARDQFAVLLMVEKRVLGSEHPHALAARHEVVRWTGHAGDQAGARDQYAALLPIRERVRGQGVGMLGAQPYSDNDLYGPGHGATLAARYELDFRNLAY